MTEEVTWVKFHFGKWRGDPALRMCSLSARGLWIDLLAYMHECDPYGHLVINGNAPTPRQIASLVGMTTEKEVLALVDELSSNGVCSLTDEGVIYSRRMVRDKKTRDEGKVNGLKGGGSPRLKGRKAPERTGGYKGDEAPALIVEKRREEERREEEKDSASLRSAAAGVPEEDPKDTLWREGVPIVRRLTKSADGSVRRMLGKMVDDAKGDHVMLLDVLRQAETLQPDQPYAWVKGAINARARGPLLSLVDPSDPYGIRAWMKGQPDVRVQTFEGKPTACINGHAIEFHAEKIAEAAGFDETWRGNWDAMGAWMREDLPMLDAPVLREIDRMARSIGVSVGSIKAFDKIVRGAERAA